MTSEWPIVRSDHVALRKRLRIALRECQSYRLRLQSTFEYIEEMEKQNQSLNQIEDDSGIEAGFEKPDTSGSVDGIEAGTINQHTNEDLRRRHRIEQTDLQEKLRRLQSKVEQATLNASIVSQEKASLEHEKDELVLEIDAERTRARHAIDLADSEVQNLATSLETLRIANEELQKCVSEKDSAVIELQNRIEKHDRDAEDTAIASLKQMKTMQNEKEALMEANITLKAELKQAESQNMEMVHAFKEELQNAADEISSKNSVVDALNIRLKQERDRGNNLEDMVKKIQESSEREKEELVEQVKGLEDEVKKTQESTEREKEELVKKVEGLESSEREKDELVKGLEEEVKKIQESSEQEKDELVKGLEDELKKIQESSEREKDELIKQVDGLEEEVNKIQREKGELIVKVKGLEDEVIKIRESSEREKEELIKQVEGLEEDVKKIQESSEREMDELVKQVDGLAGEKAEMQTHIEELKHEIQQKARVHGDQHDAMNEQLEQVKHELEKKTHEIDAERNQQQLKNGALETEIQTMKNEHTHIKAQLEQEKKEKHEQAEQLSKAHAEILENQREISAMNTTMTHKAERFAEQLNMAEAALLELENEVCVIKEHAKQREQALEKQLAEMMLLQQKEEEAAADGAVPVEELFEYLSIGLLRNEITESGFTRALGGTIVSDSRGLEEVFGVVSLYQRLLRVSQQMSSVVKKEVAVPLIANTVLEMVSASNVSVYMIDTDDGLLECSAFVAAAADAPPKLGHIVELGEATLVGKAAIQHTLQSNQENTTRCAAIVDGSGRTLGVIEAVKTAEEPWTITCEALLTHLSMQASLILTRSKQFEDEVRSKQRTEALLEIVKAVSRNDDIDDVISRVISTAYSVLRCDRISMFMVDTFTNELWFKVSKDAQGFRLPIGQGIAGHVAATAEILNIANAYDEPKFNPEVDRLTNYHTHTILCLPVCDHRGRPVAVMQAINKHCSHCSSVPCTKHRVQFDASDVDIMLAFARETASALQRKSLESAFQQAMGMENGQSDVHDYISQFMGSTASARPKSRLMDLSEEAKETETERAPLVVKTPKASKAGTVRRHGSAALMWPVMDAFLPSGSDLASWDFDYFGENGSENNLLGCTERIFEELKLVETFKIPRHTLHAFIMEIRQRYKENPYHNFMHGFSVLHMTYLLITLTKVSTKIDMMHILGIAIAALGHDVEHPGTNNDYLINTGSNLALLYNDKSVLENHHAATTCKVMQMEGCEVLAALSPSQRKQIRAIVIEAILHTDMQYHSKVLAQLQEMVSSNGLSEFTRDDDIHQALLCNSILHCSDIGNPLLGAETSERWAHLIQEEFYAQASAEKAAGLPYITFMATKTKLSLANLQINFINYVVNPIWAVMGELMPEIDEGLKNMANNKLNWERIKAEQLAKQQREEEEEEEISPQEDDGAATSDAPDEAVNEQQEEEDASDDMEPADTKLGYERDQAEADTATTGEEHDIAQEQPQQPSKQAPGTVEQE